MGWRLYVQDENEKEVVSFSRNSEVYDRLTNLPVGWYDNDPRPLSLEDLGYEVQELSDEISKFKTRIFMEFAAGKNVTEFLASYEYLEELLDARSQLMFLAELVETSKSRYFLWAG